MNDLWLFPIKKDHFIQYTEDLILKTIYGKRIAETFLERLGGIQDLIQSCQDQSRAKGTITAIDGRELFSRSPHSALNLLLQGSAGVIGKQWMVNYHRIARDKFNLVHGQDYFQYAYIHDEYQCGCLIPKVPQLCEALETGASKITTDFNTNIPIRSDATSGLSWAATH